MSVAAQCMSCVTDGCTLVHEAILLFNLGAWLSVPSGEHFSFRVDEVILNGLDLHLGSDWSSYWRENQCRHQHPDDGPFCQQLPWNE